MKQVIITTDTAEEMQKLLAVARKAKLNFEAVAIKKKPAATKKAAQPAIGKVKDNVLSEDELMLAAIAEGRKSEHVDPERFKKSLRAQIITSPGKPATDAELVALLSESESGRGVSLDTTLKSVKRKLKKQLLVK